ncbi:MAG: rRNA maturation RNase YbeY [Chloroflexota bacterium]
MIHVNFNPILDITLDVGLLVNAGQTTIQEVDPDRETEITLVISDDALIKDLNRQFRKMDSVTDVLSFPSNEIDLDTGKPYLGDIIISYPQALQQADQAGHPVETELQLLTIHGMLHLLGFDHANDEEKKEMWAIQAKILGKLGLADIKILDDQE